jgi:parallel beta-helix repeat protein
VILLVITTSINSLIINSDKFKDDVKNKTGSKEELLSENEKSDNIMDDYSGIYYLHDDLPEHGQNIGNTHDVGDLQREQPHGYEERYCAKWVQFDFDEHVFGENNDEDCFTIVNVYYHIWWKSASENAKIGTEVHGLYDSSTDYSYAVSHDDAVSTMEKNGYWLTTNLQKVGYFQEDIHDMSIKVVSIDAIPSAYSGTNQYSFIILNLEDNETLRAHDRDADGLSDYHELFTYFTNPEDQDTDNDGLNDDEEVVEGVDGFITDPNNFDTDNDDIQDGDDSHPLVTRFRIIDDEWIVEKIEVIKGEFLLVRNNITVLKGGTLTIENTVLKMNQEGEQYSIRVEFGGELNIQNSRLVTNDPDHWYSYTLQTEHWHDERTIEIYGKATIVNNIIDYGGIIYIRFSNNTEIKGNEISHFYYGIFCSYSTPTIKDNTILPFIGNGIFLWHSSPFITNTTISTYIGTGISCYYSSPIIKDSEIHGGSNDLFLSGGSHPILSNTKFNTSMVHIDDGDSSILIGTFDSEDQQVNENFQEEVRPNYINSILGIGIIISLLVLFLYFLSRIHAESEHKDTVSSAKKKEGKGGRGTKIRPKKSWKKK